MVCRTFVSPPILAQGGHVHVYLGPATYLMPFMIASEHSLEIKGIGGEGSPILLVAPIPGVVPGSSKVKVFAPQSSIDRKRVPQFHYSDGYLQISSALASIGKRCRHAIWPP